jgi:acetyl-CoA carboxylase alpha subunit
MTAYKLHRVTSQHGAQPIRTLLASLEILLVTFTSNAVVLTSLLQDRGYKKSKYRHVQELHIIPKTPRSGTRPSNWGDSVEDLIVLMGDRRIEDHGAAIGMEVLRVDGRSVVVQKPTKGDEDRERGKGKSMDGMVSPLPSAKLQDIRVATTWEISHETNDRRGRSYYSDS